MTDELYFIALIERALQATEPKAALLEAFQTIKAQNNAQSASQGFSQFEQFMDTVVRHAADKTAILTAQVFNLVHELMTELATDSFVGAEQDRQAALDLIQSRPQWRQEYVQLLTELREAFDRTQEASLLLERDGQSIATWSKVKVGETRSVGDLGPGFYRLKLDTGRVLWQGTLTEREVLWTVAYPGRPLRLAAAQGQYPDQPTLEAHLLANELLLRIFPGLESGRIEVIRKDKAEVA